jgi:hypothetical protein
MAANATNTKPPMRDSTLSEAQLLEIGMEVLYRRPHSERYELRLFLSHFGTKPLFALMIWRHLHAFGYLNDIQNPNPVHFLWALLFLKLYPKETVMESMLERSSKTIKKWVNFYIEGIASLDHRMVCMYPLSRCYYYGV